MGLHARAQEFDQTERRISVRSRVNCPVEVQLPSGTRIGTMWDLSERGARVHMDRPPQVGASVVLVWTCHDARGTVVWATENMCGLMFDKEISLARVVELEQFREEFEGPVAEVSNIPLGNKRRRLGGER